MTTETDKIVDEWKKEIFPSSVWSSDLALLKSRLNEYFNNRSPDIKPSNSVITTPDNGTKLETTNTRQFVPIKSISEGKTGYTSGESRKAKICECDCHMLIGGSGHICPRCFREIKEAKGQVRE